MPIFSPGETYLSFTSAFQLFIFPNICIASFLPLERETFFFSRKKKPTEKIQAGHEGSVSHHFCLPSEVQVQAVGVEGGSDRLREGHFQHCYNG